MSTLERAVAIAVESHTGQTDKAGAPYLLHPLRLMLQMATFEERVVAVLHDVVEDGDWSLDRLRGEGFSDRVLQAIDSLTRRPDESYEKFILRTARNPLARKVKLADLRDNADLSRIPEPTARDRARAAKYERAIEVLEGRTPPTAG